MNIILEPHQRLFFTSDTHYGHANLCRGISRWNKTISEMRDFETIEKMNHVLVASINKKVNKGDILVHLGDFSFGGFRNIHSFRESILCKQVHLVLGNHDKFIKENKGSVHELFSSVQDYLLLSVKIPGSNPSEKWKRNMFCCFHYPMLTWPGAQNGGYHLFGHMHWKGQKRFLKGKAMDVGVDGNDYVPYEMSEILDLLGDRKDVKINI